MLRRLIGVMASALLMLPLAASASGEAHPIPFSDLELVEPERHYSDTQECVAPEAEMRRNHMNYILHQRDATMHEGVRTRQFALEECINCHAVEDESGEFVRVEDPRHFCASCHTYAAVKIDCFQCHADVPVRPSTLHGSQQSTLLDDMERQLAGTLSQPLRQFADSEEVKSQ
jgi:hypothetical protein